MWIVAALALELVRVEVQQVRLRQALDLRLRAAAVLDTLAETRHAVDADRDGSGHAAGAIDWAARVAAALPDGRIAATTATTATASDGGAIRVEVSWRRGWGGGRPGHLRPAPGANLSGTTACTAGGALRDCVAIVLPDRPAMLAGSAAFRLPVPPVFPSTPSTPSPLSSPVHTLPRRGMREAGHSILELLIAAVLGGMVVTAALSVYQARRDSQARRVDDARMRMDGQAAIDLLRAHARLAGYGLSFTAGTARALPAIVNCPAGARRKSSCLQSIPGSDGLMIHYRADTVSASRGAGTSGLLDCGGRLLPSRGTVTAARVAVLKERDQGLLRLHCRGLGQGSGDPLVEGVERLQIRYWLAGLREPLAAHALGDLGPAIRAVEFCVTVRGHVRAHVRTHYTRLPRRGAAPPGAYRDCERRWQPAAPDGYARRTFTVTVALRNPGNAAGAQDVDRDAGRRL